MTPLRLPFESQREVARRIPAKLRVLARLQQGPATTLELIAVGGTRAPARTHELREEGWPIVVESDPGTPGRYVYRLTGPQQPVF